MARPPSPMIPARKLPPFNFFLRRWLGATLQRRFHGVRLAGGEHIRALSGGGNQTGPVVGCVNHTNWWDGFVLYVLSHRRLPHEIYLAMEEENLRRYRFFSWMGVFGIDLSSRGGALAGLRYAVRLLSGGNDQHRPPSLVWMFVQGALVGPRQAVEVKPGASFLAQRTGARLLPVVLRYEWLQESRPTVFVRVGSALASDAAADTLAARMNELLAQTDADIERRDFSAWEDLLPAGMSMNKRWDYLVHLLAGSRRRRFERQNG